MRRYGRGTCEGSHSSGVLSNTRKYSKRGFSPQQGKDPARAGEIFLVDGQGKMGEIVRVGDRVQVEVQVDDLELFETGSDEPDQGTGCGEASEPVYKR